MCEVDNPGSFITRFANWFCVCLTLKRFGAKTGVDLAGIGTMGGDSVANEPSQAFHACWCVCVCVSGPAKKLFASGQVEPHCKAAV